jgi:hypothetical protein
MSDTGLSPRTPCHVTQGTFYTGAYFSQLESYVLTERSVRWVALSVARGP